jgi:hypothetical protein
MAVTKLLRIKEGKGSRQNRPLLDALKYICNPEKTKDLYIGGNAGWSAESAFHQMVENKKVWRKPDGTQAFHYILSFPPTEYITPETAMKVTEDFCRELLGEDDFLYLYTIHVDRQHLHAHIVFDSVSRTDGRKFHSPKGDCEKRIQPITDRVCRKYGLSTLSYEEERKGKDYGEWRNQKMREKGIRSEKPTWQDLIRDDIDEAIAASSTYEEFLSYMRSLHYEVRDGKYLSLHAEERQRAIRTYRLGEGYGKEEIQNRILERRKQQEQEDQQNREDQSYQQSQEAEPEYFVYGNLQEIRELLFIRVRRSPGGRWRMSPYQRQLYLRYWRICKMHYPYRKRRYIPRKEIVRLEEFSENLRYLIDRDIRTQEQAEESEKDLQDQMRSDRRKLNEIYRMLKEFPEDEKLLQAKSVFLTKLREDRHELKMLESIRMQGLEEEQREEMGRTPDEKVKSRTNQERQQVRL